jgi:site-specific DNA-adenine methylase
MPFVGNGDVFFNLFDKARIFEKAYLSDKNSLLMKCYEHVMETPDTVAKVLEHLCRKHCKELFTNIKLDTSPAAYLYLMRATGGDISRDWSETEYNRRGKLMSADVSEIDKCSRYLNKWCKGFSSLITSKWEFAVEPAKKDDVIFFYPPYPRVRFEDNEFRQSDHIFLNNYCNTLPRLGIKAFLLIDDSKLVQQIYGNKFKRISNGERLYVY